jgi:transcriptional regulator with XRE-family HTH domain
LASYRYRQSLDGGPLSPEQLGEQLGVSGDTIRRWEKDRSRPSQADLARFAEVCGLAPIEREFLIWAFSGRQLNPPPSEQAFHDFAASALTAGVPALILDEFHYVRAWNSYHPGILQSPGPGPLTHFHEIFGRFIPNEAPNNRPENFQRWLRYFWMSTAPFASSPGYRRLIEQLRRSPEFERRWRSMGLERDESIAEPVNAPRYIEHDVIGTWRIFSTAVTLPPAYYLREYFPLDEKAQAHMRRIGASRPLKVFTKDIIHWTLEPE